METQYTIPRFRIMDSFAVLPELHGRRGMCDDGQPNSPRNLHKHRTFELWRRLNPPYLIDVRRIRDLEELEMLRNQTQL